MGIEIGFALGALLLGGAIAFGMIRSRQHNPANEAVTEEATKELYRDPDNYSDLKREQIAAKVER